MSETHYYYSMNRKAAERIAGLTWNQFLEKFGWGSRSQWSGIGEYLAYGLERPRLPDEPTPEEIAPILRWTIRATIPRMSPQYFCLLELSYHLRRHSFVKVDLDAEGLEDEWDALNICALLAFLNGDIDDRTLWCVLTLHEGWAPDLFERIDLPLNDSQRRSIRAVRKRFGVCRPVFDWQTLSAVRDGHTTLHEEDTRRFARFVRAAWRKNWPVFSDGQQLLRFRDFELARILHDASPALPGNCLIHYCGA